MKTIILSLCLCLTFTGCDKEVARVNGQSHTEERMRSGNKFGYCFTCMPGFDGKMECKLKMSSFCPCTYKATVNVTPYTARYESGKKRNGESVSELKKLTPCI